LFSQFFAKRASFLINVRLWAKNITQRRKAAELRKEMRDQINFILKLILCFDFFAITLRF